MTPAPEERNILPPINGLIKNESPRCYKHSVPTALKRTARSPRFLLMLQYNVHTLSGSAVTRRRGSNNSSSARIFRLRPCELLRRIIRWETQGRQVARDSQSPLATR